MDTVERQALEERVKKEVHVMLTEGDQAYLEGLSRDALLEALENELRFLGLYAYEDQESPIVIRDFLRQNLDEWWKKPDVRVQLTESPLLAWAFSGMAAGSLITKQHLNFAPIQRPAQNTGNGSLLKVGEATQHISFAPSKPQDLEVRPYE